ncbi:cell division protein FtsH [Dehalococcoides mccartyi]|uniref:Cell division protein FtsH n=1 Tax=Dehalococcoides mccartyi TaxID=61435 RepID=A0AB38Z8B1_9CHLR|nr:cell division protein FtsH [Dehalococcoides mccartyi]WRO06727.1 cell division protein FtsH [Dehalococcoides mccartyi]
MYSTQQVSGPVAPGQFGPMQVSGPGSYYPTQTTGTDWSSMFSMMMPMIMMIMMMAIMMPMLKGVTGAAKD